VVRTRVGYAGGTTTHPTYRRLGDHTETVEIDFDPARISYRELLDVFWKSHDPGSRSWSRQYKAAIFFHSEAQRKLAFESKEKEEARLGAKIFTEILPFTGFTLAEDYHQKYRLRQEPDILAAFEQIYPAERDFVNSTAAARVNGYLGGYGTPEELKKEIDGYGLPQPARKRLLEMLSSARPAFKSCPL
jgi:peptide-methionine (S)-S-oxide reductase